MPAQIGRYQVRKELGRGTMGVVYEAYDPELGRTVALKTISLAFANHEEFERRFLIEARIAARLSHPGIVVVHDVGRDAAGGVFMALEYLVGRTLAQVLATDGKLEWREALRIVARVAEALHHAHSHGVVHRDIKPANIMLLGTGQPKIMDFGVAKQDATQLTSPGQLFGTPLYMAPEQALGEPTDGRADLYSLGSVLYAMVTGRPPFEASDVATVLAQVAHRQARPPSSVVPGLPTDLDYVVARAMAKSPADRYADGQALAEDVEDVRASRPLRHRAEWTPPPVGERTLVGQAGASATPELPLLDLEASAGARRRSSAPSRRRRPSLLLVVLLAAAGALYFHLHAGDRSFWREQWQRLGPHDSVRRASAWLDSLARPAPSSPARVLPTSPPSTTIEVAAEAPAAAAVPAPEPPTEPVAAAVPPADAAAPEPSPATPSASPSPSGSAGVPEVAAPAPEPPAAAATQRPAPAARPAADPEPQAGRLAITLENHLKSGILEVWVDGRFVFKETLDSRVERKSLLFPMRKGGRQTTLSLSPGRHEVRLDVLREKKRTSAKSTTTFRAGLTRRLEAKVSRSGNDLDLDWK